MIDEKKSRGGDHHRERVTEVIARLAAEFIAREAGSESLITVIRAMPLRHGELVVVFVGVIPEEQTRAALSYLERHREAFSNYLRAHARLGPLPRIDFQVDNGEQLDIVVGGPGGN